MQNKFKIGDKVVLSQRALDYLWKHDTRVCRLEDPALFEAVIFSLGTEMVRQEGAGDAPSYDLENISPSYGWGLKNWSEHDLEFKYVRDISKEVVFLRII